MEIVHGRRRQRSSPAPMSSRPHQPYAGNSSHPRLRWLMLETVLGRRRRQRSSLIVKPFKPHEPHATNSSESDPHQLCSGKSSSSHLRWLMLDQFVHRTKGDGTEVVGDGTLSEISFTCTGKTIRVSLRVAEPPAVSRLHLHWPEGFRPELRQLNEPSVVTAHGDSILFMAFVPLLENYWYCPPYYYPLDYFVYTASRSEKPPSLTQLPPCFTGGQKDTESDSYYRPYRFQQQRMMFSSDIGLLCRGDGKFTVAELSYTGELCLLHYAPGEKDLQWEIKQLAMPYDEGTPNLLRGSWQTDAVIPFRERYLCWADNYLGLLFVDVLGKHSNPTLHVPLPAALDPKRLHTDLGVPDPARRVCATESGTTIRLISISNRSGRSVHVRSNSSFVIRIWSLINAIEQAEWEEVAVVKQREFWSVLHTDRRLPHCAPKFPVLSLVDPDVIFFQLHDSCSHIFWLVEIDLKKNKLGAVTLYIDDEEEGRSADDTAPRNVFHGHSFILSQFTQHMDKNVIKSLEYSEKLQKAKLEHALEKR